jgi:hypothetical protein
MKHKKHDKIIKSYKEQKQNVLKKEADVLLKKDKYFTKLKGIKINPKFLNKL